jgi:hypothetical protein
VHQGLTTALETNHHAIFVRGILGILVDHDPLPFSQLYAMNEVIFPNAIRKRTLNPYQPSRVTLPFWR